MKINDIIKEFSTDSQPGKINKIQNGEVEIQNTDGTKLTAPAERLIKDPATGKLTLSKPVHTPGSPQQSTSPQNQQNMPKAGDQVTMASEELGYDEVSGKTASHILRKLDQGDDLDSVINDFPELSRMISVIAQAHGLDPNNDFEEIENVLINDLEDLANEYDQSSDDEFDDTEFDDELDDNFESVDLSSIKKLAGLQ
jgi:hypothetical protein